MATRTPRYILSQFLIDFGGCKFQPKKANVRAHFGGWAWPCLFDLCTTIEPQEVLCTQNSSDFPFLNCFSASIFIDLLSQGSSMPNPPPPLLPSPPAQSECLRAI
jgi:hypothetical protein